MFASTQNVELGKRRLKEKMLLGTSLEVLTLLRSCRSISARLAIKWLQQNERFLAPRGFELPDKH